MGLAQDAMIVGGAVIAAVLIVPKVLGGLGATGAEAITTAISEFKWPAWEWPAWEWPAWEWPDVPGWPSWQETAEQAAARLALEAQQAAEAAEREAAYQALVAAEAEQAAYCAALDPYTRDLQALSTCHMPLLPLPVTQDLVQQALELEAAQAEAEAHLAAMLAQYPAATCDPGAVRCTSIGTQEQCRHISPTVDAWVPVQDPFGTCTITEEAPPLAVPPVHCAYKDWNCLSAVGLYYGPYSPEYETAKEYW